MSIPSIVDDSGLRLSVDKILQISNDISEDMLNPKTTRAELVEVVKFFRNLCDEKHERYMTFLMKLGSLHINEILSLTNPKP